MNIFVLEDCPVKAAEVQCDKHVVKMIVESGQMLSTAHRMLDGDLEVYINANGRKARRYNLNDWRQQVLYKAVHYHHPCTVWTMESSENYKWHYEHFLALCDEYTYRYDKTHKTDRILRDILSVMPVNMPQKNTLTEFKLAMKANPECIALGDPVKAYQAFYQTKQTRFNMVWTRRDVPDWFQRVCA